MSFLEHVRSQNVSSPVHRSFDLNKWKNAYKDNRQNSDCDNIYLSGLIFDNILTSLRSKYEECIRWSDRSTHIRYLIGIANRDDLIIKKELENNKESIKIQEKEKKTILY